MTAAPVDPVCGMPVMDPDAPQITHAGRAYLFCSELCAATFRRDPGAHATIVVAGEVTPAERRIAYFSMEIALDPRFPTYSGGLGVLAGDTIRSFADLRIPAVAVTLAHRHGYFSQEVDDDGWQRETPDPWSPQLFLHEAPARAPVEVEGRPVQVRGWRHDVVGTGGYTVPVFLLDTDIEENSEPDRRLTDWLYGGDERYRLAQEVLLGVGGLRLLRELGFCRIDKIHLNEGHAALAAAELLRERSTAGSWDFEGVRRHCVFTTHTPGAAGHDRFSYDVVRSVTGELVPGDVLRMLGGQDALDMTRLALDASGRVNGVARRHGEVSREMFPGHPIGSITNGVHSTTWTSAPFQELFDAHVPGWRDDPALLRQAARIPLSEILRAHAEAKRRPLVRIAERTRRTLDPAALTIGFARRATAYKRADLVPRDLDRLRALSRMSPLQLVFAGKAHPRDVGGKDLIHRVVQASRALEREVPIVFIEGYDLELAKSLVAGVDLWLNTPRPPLEASGTSGMKAAHNGVPSLSMLDGWWLEGCVEGVTGWSIGAPPGAPGAGDDACDAEDLYAKLGVALEVFRGDPERWAAVMRMAIALNASFFNTHRMVQQYASSAYV